jgi:hypothetical protein
VNSVCQSWIVANTTGFVDSIASNGTNLVWIDGTTGAGGVGSIKEVPVGGGTPITLASMAPSYTGQEIALAGGVVAWTAVHLPTAPGGADTNAYGAFFTATDGSPGSGIAAPAAVGNKSANSSQNAGGIGLRSNGGVGYFLSRLNPAVESCPLGGINGSCTAIATSTDSALTDDLVLGGTTLFWTSFNTGSVFSIPIGSSTVTTVASGELGPAFLALDSTYVYWINFNQLTNSYGINRNTQANPNPLSPQTVLPVTAGTLQGIASDGRYVYYSGAILGSTVGYVPVAGGMAKTLYPLPSNGTGGWRIITVGGAVYWIDGDENTIRGIAAPQ